MVGSILCKKMFSFSQFLILALIFVNKKITTIYVFTYYFMPLPPFLHL